MAGVISLLIYLLIAWVIIEPNAVWSVDTGAKWLQLENLRWENGRLAFNIQYPNQENDPSFLFAHNFTMSSLLGIVDGQLHLRRLPFFPLLTLPFYRLWGAYGLYVLPALGGAALSTLTLGCIPRPYRRFSMWLLIAFASPVCIYALLFWEHTPAAALTLFAVWWALRASPLTQPTKAWQWIGIGIIMGLAAYLRLEVLIFSLTFLGSYWLLSPTHRWALVLAGMVLILVMLPYQPLHAVLFGQPMPENATYVVRPGVYMETARWQAITDLLIGTSLAQAAETGWQGLVWAITAVIAILLSLLPLPTDWVRWGQWGAMGVTAVMAATFLFRPIYYAAAHGLLFTTPWLLLAICRSRELWQTNHIQLRIITLTTTLGLLGYAIAIVGVRFGPPHGGLEWGARFAIVFYPFLAIMAGWDFKLHKSSVVAMVIIGMLIALGVGFQMRGVSLIQQSKRINHELYQAMLQTAEPTILTDLQWLPLISAPIYYQKNIYLIGENNLSDWVEMAAEHELNHFTLITFNGRVPQQITQQTPDYKVIIQDVRQFGHFIIFSLTLNPL